ncbi:MAG: thioredoxin [Fermentimonas sp.]|jgi:thioredoxin|nr:thioredoxin [Fermentimonas sp.]NLC86973.1 thioredoxin [Bacteroidales bacterium]MDD3189650.1 thioredoxin [Fermentimonas sp.]MDD3511950.1 thioredoxin [Fermentimonas sp.]MDD4285244.1 thioredoxin [Fermentimonas sp.]
MKIKRKSALLMAVALAFTLAACNSQSQQNKTNSTKTNTIKTNNNMTTTTASKTIHLTRADFLKKVANFEENPEKWVYLGDKPAIIDFYADWCGPCKMIAPILEELADEYDGQIYIYKVDTEAEQQLAAEFGIRSIPSLLFVPMGEAPQMAQGALPKDAFKQAIEEVLLKNS